MTKPTFLFIGPDKSGSSWMFHILSQHPDCYVPKAKDTYFFDRYYDKGQKWYFDHFAAAGTGAVAVGELSHDYLFSATAAERIARDLPNVVLLTCLRNPIDRALSQYQYMRRGGEVGDDFHEAVKTYPKIVNNSRYLKNLQTYLDRFGRDQVQIMIFEDLPRDAESFGKDMLTRIGLRTDVPLPYSDRVREASMARSALLSRSLKAGANLARQFGLANLVGNVKNSSAAKLAYRDIRADEKVVLTPAEKQDLWQEFEPENEALSRLVGRDLSYWKPDEAK